MPLKLSDSMSPVRRNEDHDADCVMVTRLIHCPRKIPPINIIKAERILSYVDVNVDQNIVVTLGLQARILENIRASSSHIKDQIGKAKRDCVCSKINTKMNSPSSSSSEKKDDGENSKERTAGPVITTTAPKPILIDLDPEGHLQDLQSPQRMEDEKQSPSSWRNENAARARKRRQLALHMQYGDSRPSADPIEIITVDDDDDDDDDISIISSTSCPQHNNAQADQVCPKSSENVEEPPAKQVEEGSEFEVEMGSPQQNTEDVGDATTDVDVMEAAASDDLNDEPAVSARALFGAMMKGQYLGQWPDGKTPRLGPTKFLKMSFAVNMLGRNKDRNLLEWKEPVEQKLEDTNPLWKQEVDTFSQLGFDWNAYKKGIIKEIKDSRGSSFS